jgi:Chloramphenicol phosphotransferase-like protein
MLIILNGVPNAGKTSVAKVIQAKISNTVHLEVDVLRNMYEWMPIEDAIHIALENAKSIIPNFLNRGMNLVLDYPLDPYWHSYLVNDLPEGIKVQTFTLRPRLDIVTKNRGERDISLELSERIRYLYTTNMNDPSLGIFIDNSELTANDTAGIILEKMGLDV